MAKVVNFPLARRLARPRSWVWDNFWHYVWESLPLKPSDDQRERLEVHMGACFEALSRIWKDRIVISPHRWLPDIVKKKRSDRSPWPPQEPEDWEIVIAAVEEAFVSLEKVARTGDLPPVPRKEAVPRPPDALWEAIWPEVEPNIPTDRQARFMSSLLKEIGRLRKTLGKDPVENPAGYLLKALDNISGHEWPPSDRQVWGKLAAALRDHRDNLRTAHREARRTPAQNKRIWALVAENFGGDRDYLDEILRQNFPKAQRRCKDGRLVPSTKVLSIKEASKLIDMLKHASDGGSRRRQRG